MQGSDAKQKGTRHGVREGKQKGSSVSTPGSPSEHLLPPPKKKTRKKRNVSSQVQKQSPGGGMQTLWMWFRQEENLLAKH